jgi:hypothetical protein
MRINRVTENITYKAGDKVVYREKAEQGQIWTVKKIDHRLKRCFIERRTPDRLFQKSAAFHLLMLEVDLPRRLELESKKKPKLKVERVLVEKDQGMVAGFERMVAILRFVNTYVQVDNARLKNAVMPDLSIRSVQRHTDSLVQNGYLDCFRDSMNRGGYFYITKKARALMNWPDPENINPIPDF